MRGSPATRLAQRDAGSLSRRLPQVAGPAVPRLRPLPRLARHLALLVATCGLLPWGLRAPLAVTSAASAPALSWLQSADAAPVTMRQHRVALGESLASVAAAHGLAPETLRWANGLGDLDPLVVGQELRVPPTDGVLHFLAQGETARTVAEAYGADPAAVAEYNGVADLDRALRSVQLMVPGGRPPLSGALVALGPVGLLPADAVPAGARQLRFAAATLWVVDDPERLAAAAAAARLPAQTWAQIEAEAASATAAALAASQRAVPKPQEYTVQPGDTLSGLAARYGITTLTLQAANDLTNNDALAVGQPLLVPPIDGVLYTVQDDDTLYEIALRHRVDLGPIVDYNDLESASALTIGQRLLIPGAEPERPRPPAPARAPASSALASQSQDAAPTRLANAANRVHADGRPADDDAVLFAAAAGSAKGEQMMGFAMQFLGRPYVWGGTTPAGFDCSGFVYYVHRQHGISLSRGMLGQYGAGPHITRDALQPGDIVFFSNTYMPGLSHNGIYIGNGKFVHASDPGVGVVVSSLSEAYWASRYSGATRAQ